MDINAPDFPNNLTWYNSSPLTQDKLKGKVVLVDFWTYSCINCQRTLPYLRNWWERYQKSGLVIVGVHTPEFEFEKDPGNVKEALKKYKISWPTVLDNDYKIWDSFANHSWPAKYLINAQGKIIYTHFGEGNYLETELKIQEALKNAGFKIDGKTAGLMGEDQFRAEQSPEIYCGYARGMLGNPEGYQKDTEYNYTMVNEIAPEVVYLRGAWKAAPEYLEHPATTKELDDILTLSYQSKKVYVVMESANGQEIKVYVTLDGVGLEESAGEDISYDSEGRAYILVKMPTLYNLIETKTFGDHILRIATLEKGLRVYSFTFGS